MCFININFLRYFKHRLSSSTVFEFVLNVSAIFPILCSSLSDCFSSSSPLASFILKVFYWVTSWRCHHLFETGLKSYQPHLSSVLVFSVASLSSFRSFLPVVSRQYSIRLVLWKLAEVALFLWYSTLCSFLTPRFIYFTSLPFLPLSDPFWYIFHLTLPGYFILSSFIAFIYSQFNSHLMTHVSSCRWSFCI